jgi:nucleotide-binding universal stress UspA family protein
VADRLEDRWPHPVSRDAIVAAIEQAIAAAGVTGVTATAVALEGRADELIARRAQAAPADLIVMGTHGRSGVTRLLLGSVTEKLMRTAPCPVLTVPPASAADGAATVTLDRILSPIDYSPSSLAALRYAVDFGNRSGGSVTVLYVLEGMDPDDLLDVSPADPCHRDSVESRRRRQHLLDHARARLHAQLAGVPARGTPIEAVVTADRAYKAILRHAVESRADLIVMGAQGTGGLELMLHGSNAQQVVRGATCPVLTVRA